MFRKPLVLLLVSCFIANEALAAGARKPNIVLILADDLGYETLGCNGGESYKTPNLDRLAAAGMRFERCNVQPLCTPTRVELMTGMSNVRNYIEFGTMDPKATTFANLLKNAGYTTAMAGKWQLGRDKDQPQRFGFDESCLWQLTRRPPRYANPGLEYNGVERDFHNGEYGPDLVSDFALDFITKNKSKPFFLYYPMMLTHAPYQPTPDSPDWDPKATGEKEGKGAKHFGDMVAYMDKLVGKLVTKLDDLKIRDNTLVIFLGDNGTGKGVTSRLHGAAYAGGKGTTNARGMHVPLVVNWPGHIKKGSVNDDLIDSTDFLPTICQAAGVKVPASLKIDGQSFWPQLMGEKGQPREWIYTWYSQNGQPPIREFVASKEYKLYRSGKFFDLKSDPFEDREPKQLADLTGAEADAASKLKDVLVQYADARPADLMAKSKTGKSPEKNAAKRTPQQKAARTARRQAKKTGTGE
jgi:arylsulfatase A